ncbi:hypothetical protein Tco_0892936 [Tanacetum coccineum]|uniref:Translocon at the inner envelope membrane of chloroplasts 214 n=1 Tax=Tanacetum coccineum TaxID=301880 RepID=A0ABQ5C8W4_9ASTR
MEQMTSICDMVGQIMQKKGRNESEMRKEESGKDSHICEPEYSLIMWDENIDTIPEKESDELIKSSVENLVPSNDDESLSDEERSRENSKFIESRLFDDEGTHFTARLIRPFL